MIEKKEKKYSIDFKKALMKIESLAISNLVLKIMRIKI